MTPRTVWRGETHYAQSDIAENPSPDEFAIRRFQLCRVKTIKSSWTDVGTGYYDDVLMPVDAPGIAASISAITVLPGAKPGLRAFQAATQEPLFLEIADKSLPQERIFPFYSEVNSNDCLQAFRIRGGLEPNRKGDDYQLQFIITHHAVSLARQFGIEPVKQSIHWFEDPMTSADVVITLMKDYKYDDLVFQGRIAKPIIFCGSWDFDGSWRRQHPDVPYHPNKTFLAEVNRRAPQGTMAWCADEPRLPGDDSGMPVPAAIERVKYVLQHAPRLIPMITTGENSLKELRALADKEKLPICYCIVQNHDSPLLFPNAKGSYFSCMAQGCDDYDPSDASGKPQKKRTSFPVAVVEGCPIADFQGAIKLAYKNKALFALYYKITKRLKHCWLDGGIYNEGGNGDGTAMYIHPCTGLAIPSVRMMHWHIAQQEIEKKMLAG
jgi:hypothetical protein